MDIVTISGRNYDSNVYVIDGKHPTIVDTGTGLFSTDIIKEIQEHFPLSSLQHIILTHEHFDHVGGTPDVLKAAEHNAKVVAHTNAIEKLQQGESSFAHMLGCKMPTIHVDTPVSENDVVVCGDEKFTVLYTPGHSLGSICLYHEKENILISGDTIFANGDFGRYDFPGGHFQSLVQSIKRLSKLDVICLYPGHGPIVEENGKTHVMRSFQNIQSMMDTTSTNTFL